MKAESVFFTVYKAFDILFMSPECHHGQERHHKIHFRPVGLIHPVIPQLTENDHAHKSDHIAGKGTKGYIMKSQKQHCEHGQTDQKDPVVESQHHAC